MFKHAKSFISQSSVLLRVFSLYSCSNMSPQRPGNKCVFHDFVRSAPPPGYFMYIEASLMRPGHKARLLTSDLRGSSSPQCLIFYYNMYGSGMGILSVLLRRGDRERDTLLWRRRGEQSISWMRAMVDYDCDVRHQVRGTQTVCKHVRCPTAVSSVFVWSYAPIKHLNVKHVKLKYVTLTITSLHLSQLAHACHR